MSKTPDWFKVSDEAWAAMTPDEQAAHKQRVYEWRMARQASNPVSDETKALSAKSNRAERRHAQMTRDRGW